MTLLADLARRVPSLRQETTGTEALGVLLRHPHAASALAAFLRSAGVDLPEPLSFSTQVVDADGRPDLVARNDAREVLLIEGKFWFGFTERQSNGAYLRRLENEHAKKAPLEPHVGALLFVVPVGRLTEVFGKLTQLYRLTGATSTAEWKFAKAPGGVIVSVCSWQQLLAVLMSSGTPALVADSEQLIGLVDAVDERAFVPWSVEAVTDRDVAKRIYQLASLVDAVRGEAIRKGVATHTGGRRVTIKRTALAYGKTLTLGGVPAILSVALAQWAAHGTSPLWLRFRSGAALAKAAFGDLCRDTSDGVAIPVPLPVYCIEQDAIDSIVTWLAERAEQLETERAQNAVPILPAEDLPDADYE